MVGLKIPLTTYVARHTWASVALHMNIPVATISEGMGHNSYKTTQIYLESIDVATINEAKKNHSIKMIFLYRKQSFKMRNCFFRLF